MTGPRSRAEPKRRFLSPVWKGVIRGLDWTGLDLYLSRLVSSLDTDYYGRARLVGWFGCGSVFVQRPAYWSRPAEHLPAAASWSRSSSLGTSFPVGDEEKS
ncbi:uncharacterized protein AKAW2_11408A [Aspergillus luchuensis]|uniref:Uncharacterized protein n=1 Tax=Aspergillus kawachii TaxID=1069201 RepID=A0A7R7W0Y9_ASPKA|nr:uncharacterized protein AKAW2_11408A [Aspergillus luchuensis]BCR94362.1 hypothetical protein AKAW2_11408A [Aspergillus luchuensis]